MARLVVAESQGGVLCPRKCHTEGVAYRSDAELDTAIRTRAAARSFGDQLIEVGTAIVALAADGSIVEYHADSSKAVLTPAPATD
jgi:hypothetical protein